MATRTFAGGIYLYDGKELSRDREIRTVLPAEGEMAFPLQQHIGAPSLPVVRVGQQVLAGQMIAVTDGELSSNLHSSVSGHVVAIEDVPDVSGQPVPSIVIHNNGLFQDMPYPKDRDLSRLSRARVIEIIRDAGIVGMGGSGLPTHYKLRHSDAGRIDTVIANCVECEPYLTSDYRRLLEDPWKIINGLMVLLHIYPKARGIIAVSGGNRAGYRWLRRVLMDYPDIHVQQCSAKYPQGSERQLIHALTGRTLNARMLPYEIGCLVLNTDTLGAINQAVIMHEPLITRIITVSGPAADTPCNLRVRCGMSYGEVLEQAGGLKRGYNAGNTLILDGGPLMGREILDLNAPVTKLSSAITCFPKSDVASKRETPCIRCRRCTAACPNRIVPMQLIRDARAGNHRAFVDHAGLECCDCGCCSYICPAGIDLAAGISAMKRECLQNENLSGDYAKRFQR